jgi:hypothetical protein
MAKSRIVNMSDDLYTACVARHESSLKYMSKEEKHDKLLALMIVEESVDYFWSSIMKHVDTHKQVFRTNKAADYFSCSGLDDTSKNESLSDVIVRCRSKTWKLHQFVICNRCQFFKAACQGPFSVSSKEAVRDHF